jgi:hypothetical protein
MLCKLRLLDTSTEGQPHAALYSEVLPLMSSKILSDAVWISSSKPNSVTSARDMKFSLKPVSILARG